MSTVLIASVWLASLGPQLSAYDFAGEQACRIALSRTAVVVQEQSRSNLVVPHNDVRIERNEDGSRAVLRTPVGREVARLECLKVE
jgi:serine/threonine protein kinase HipA of HipAB toxin-antitoxin module